MKILANKTTASGDSCVYGHASERIISFSKSCTVQVNVHSSMNLTIHPTEERKIKNDVTMQPRLMKISCLWHKTFFACDFRCSFCFLFSLSKTHNILQGTVMEKLKC